MSVRGEQAGLRCPSPARVQLAAWRPPRNPTLELDTCPHTRPPARPPVFLQLTLSYDGFTLTNSPGSAFLRLVGIHPQDLTIDIGVLCCYYLALVSIGPFAVRGGGGPSGLGGDFTGSCSRCCCCCCCSTASIAGAARLYGHVHGNAPCPPALGPVGAVKCSWWQVAGLAPDLQLHRC